MVHFISDIKKLSSFEKLEEPPKELLFEDYIAHRNFRLKRSEALDILEICLASKLDGVV